MRPSSLLQGLADFLKFQSLISNSTMGKEAYQTYVLPSSLAYPRLGHVPSLQVRNLYSLSPIVECIDMGVASQKRRSINSTSNACSPPSAEALYH